MMSLPEKEIFEKLNSCSFVSDDVCLMNRFRHIESKKVKSPYLGSGLTPKRKFELGESSNNGAFFQVMCCWSSNNFFFFSNLNLYLYCHLIDILDIYKDAILLIFSWQWYCNWLQFSWWSSHQMGGPMTSISSDPLRSSKPSPGKTFVTRCRCRRNVRRWGDLEDIDFKVDPEKGEVGGYGLVL